MFASRIVETLSSEIEAPVSAWPARHISDEGIARPFHRGQELAHDSPRRIVALLAGTQGGKTSYDPWWLYQEILRKGTGDYLAVTATFDLFKLRMMPAMLEVFETILGLGRYWASERMIEIADPTTGRFYARRAMDRMWSRIILRSADTKGGLEASTAKAALLDEAGLPEFTIQTYRAIRRRLALNRGRILITSTLYDVGWLDKEIMDKAENGGQKSIENLTLYPDTQNEIETEIEVTDNPHADVCMIQFDSILNPHYPIEEYIEAQEDLPKEDFEMQHRGRRSSMRTRIYDTFTRQRDTCKRFPIPPSWKRYMGMDFGGVHTAALFYAEEPGTEILYCHRSYLAGSKKAKEHAEDLLKGEPGRPFTVGGSKSEGQWRDEFAGGGLPIKPPLITDVALGITIVYAETKNHRIIYFDDLEAVIQQKEGYRRKRGPDGEPIDEIENKAAYHFLDAERYLVSLIRGERGRPPDYDKFRQLGQVEDYESKWG